MPEAGVNSDSSARQLYRGAAQACRHWGSVQVTTSKPRITASTDSHPNSFYLHLTWDFVTGTSGAQ